MNGWSGKIFLPWLPDSDTFQIRWIIRSRNMIFYDIQVIVCKQLRACYMDQQ